MSVVSAEHQETRAKPLGSVIGLTAARLDIRAVSFILVSVVDFARQDNAEGRAVAGPSLILEHAAMLLHDARDNCQAEASACFLGAEERVEKVLLSLGRDAFAGVAHFKNNGLRLAPAERGACRSRAQRDRAFAVDGFCGIANKVDENLFQMAAIGADEQLWAGFNHESQSAALQVRGNQATNFANYGLGCEGFQLGI